MMIQNLRIKFIFSIVVLSIIAIYWTIDSIWSFISYEENLKVLIHSQPTSYIDSFLLKIPPYQIVARIIVSVIFIVSGYFLYMLMIKTKETEQKYYDIFHNSQEAIILLGDNKIIDCNEMAVKLFKYKNKQELIHLFLKKQKDHNILNEKIKEALTDKFTRFKLRCKDANNEDISIEITLSKTSTHEDILLGLVRNVSDVEHLTKSLKSSENRFKTLVETIPFGIQEVDLEGRIIRANKTLHDMFDSFDNDLEGRYIWEIPNTDCERESLKKYFQDHISKGLPPEVWRGMNSTPAGRRIHINVHWNYIRDEDTSKIIGVACVLIDVTKEVRAQLYRDTFNHILNELNKSADIKRTVHESLIVLKEAFQVRATSIRLFNGLDYPFFEHNGLSKFHLDPEKGCISLLSDSPEDEVLQCICGGVLDGSCPALRGGTTEYGTYWVNNLTEFFRDLQLEGKQDCRRQFHVSCKTAGYNSLCLVPLKTGNDNFGLLQIFDRRKNVFDKDHINFFEAIADSLSISLSRKLTQQELLRSESILKSIFNAAPIGMGLIVYPSRIFKKVNRQFKEMLGYEEDELIDKNALMIYPNKEEYDRVKETKIQNVEKTGTGSIEVKLRRKNQEIIDVLLSSSKVDDTDNIIFTALDITDKKKQQRAIIDSETVFRTAFETIPDAVAINRQDNGNYIHLNEGYISMSGYERQELIGSTSFKLWKSYEMRKGLIDKMKEVGSVSNYEMQFVRKDGSVRDGLMSSASIILDNVPCTLTITRDITERKKREKDLIENERQLRRIAKMEAVGTLAGGVAHDFNNIIQIISGNVQLLMLDADDELKKKLIIMYNATLRGADLSRRLLTFSKNVESQLQPMNINEEIKLVHKLLGRTVSGPFLIEVNLELDPELNLALADPAQINQVITNLSINAKDAMPNGGHINISTHNIELDSLYVQQYPDVIPGKYVVVSFSDNGVGMSKELQERIFEPFFSTKSPGKGTGLGLAVVYGIIQSHNGHLTVYSSPGKGTEFKMYIPVANEADLIVEKTKQENVYEYGNETILVIDDEDDIRLISHDVLSRYGYTVLTASSGDEGIDLYKEKKGEIDLVILDLVMPKKGGLEVLKEIKEFDPSAKIIIASGYSTNGPIKEVIDRGAKAVANKPYTLKEILTKVRTTLDDEGEIQ